MSITQITTHHMASTNLYQYYHCIKRVYSMDRNVFNSLPQSVKNLSDNPKQFKSAIKNYLRAHSFYSTEPYFHGNKDKLSQTTLKPTVLYQQLLYSSILSLYQKSLLNWHRCVQQSPTKRKDLSDSPKQFKSASRIIYMLIPPTLQRHTFMETEKDKLS